MRWPRVRFTVRRMMGVILLTALALVVCRFLSELWADFDDTYYFSSRQVERSWDAGPSPEILVDTFAGRICVVQALDENVSVRVLPHVITKESQAAADRVCSAIQLGLTQEAGVIRITAPPPPELPRYRMDVDVELHVPPEARLDLHTRQGEVFVGQTYVGAYLVRSPTIVRSIKARADFNGQDWSHQGDIFVEMARSRNGAPSSPPPLLQLEGVRQIQISAEDAQILARARGGTYVVRHETTTGAIHQTHEVEGKIRFIGTLSEGPSRFWAAHGINLQLPGGGAFGLDAEANRGTVTCTLPLNAGGIIERSRLRGVVGASPKTSVTVKVDDGPIEIQGMH